MYSASIDLPAEISDETIAVIGGGFGGLEEAFSTIRRNNKHTGPWRIEWIFDHQPDQDFLDTHLKSRCAEQDIALPAALHWQIAEVPEQDWLAVSYEEFKPFTVGPFFIYGSHYTDGVPEGLTGLQIDAATAFGSGEHGTTKGCLQAMLDLKGRGACPWNILDMGTGSGILGIAAWKLWETPVLAVDNDDEAVRVAIVHRDLNAVPAEMICACGDGFAEPTTQQKKPYDLVIANILAIALREMGDDLTAITDENGYVILSGILNEQVQSVLDVYLPLGFSEDKRYPVGEWTSLLLQKTA